MISHKILIFLFLTNLSSQQCQRQTFENKACKLEMENCDNEQTFKRCWKQQIKIYNEEECAKTCCGGKGKKQLTKELIDSCFGIGETALILIIVFSLFGLIVVCGIMRAIGKHFRKTRNSFRVQDSSETKRAVNEEENSIQNLDESKNREENVEQLEKDICSICLDGNVNVITTCNHRFHLDCLSKWSYRKTTCPLCNKEELVNLKIFCSKCFGNIVQVKNIQVFQLEKPEIKREILCQQCLLGSKKKPAEAEKQQKQQYSRHDYIE